MVASLHPAPGAALPGQAGRGRRRVHRLRRRRRATHAGADQRSAHLLARRHAAARAAGCGPTRARWSTRWSLTWRRPSRTAAPAVTPRRPAERAGRSDPAPPAVPEPDRQRHQVSPPRRDHRACTSRAPAGDGAWIFAVQRQRHRHRAAVPGANLRAVPAAAHARRVSRHRHRPGDLQEDRRTPRRHDAGRLAVRDAGPRSRSRCRASLRGER